MDHEQLDQYAQRHLIATGLLQEGGPPPDAPIFARAFGSEIEDVRGRRYLDFNSGQMCAALGHNHPRIVAAIEESCRTVIHASSVYHNVPQILLARRLAELLPPTLNRSLFIQSGADSNEAAILMARRYRGSNPVAAFHLGFSGYSEMTRGLTFLASRVNYGPPVPEVYAIPAPYRYRCPVGLTASQGCCNLACLDAGFEILDAQISAPLAAVIIEPLPSAGGVIDLPPGYLPALKARCQARGALLILDEAQTGLAKLGTMFAFEQEGAVPDILTLSKHFGGGLSISATVTGDDIAARVVAGGLTFGHSHSADPIVCNAGLASLDLIVEENLPARAREIGGHVRKGLESLMDRHRLVGDLRGRGLLQAFELVRDRETKEPATAETARLADRCLEEGLLFSRRGKHMNVIRLVPPFTTAPAQVERAIGILDKVLGELEGK
jgi:2,2-dialkylglycine decarboxylase (pyruvate)